MFAIKAPDRDSLGWLIPILLLAIFYGSFLWLNEEGVLQKFGALFLLTGVIGLSFSRRVRRLVGYHIRPKTDERRASFIAVTEMERAKRQARKEKIPEFITHLYFDVIRHLPDWIAEQGSDETHIVPPVVQLAKRLPGNRMLITLDGKEYYITFVQYVYSTPEGERDAEGTLQISKVDQKLILIHLAQHGAPEGHMRPTALEYVALGDWVNDFKHLEEEIGEERARRLHEDRMN